MVLPIVAVASPLWLVLLSFLNACATFSALVLLSYPIARLARNCARKLDGSRIDEGTSSVPESPHPQDESRFAATIWELLRLIACIALTSLTIVTVLLASKEEDHSLSLRWAIPLVGIHERQSVTFPSTVFEILLFSFYTYTALLSIFTVTLEPHLRARASTHLTTLLLLAFGIHSYLSLFPLAFSAGAIIIVLANIWITWIHLATLGFAAVVIPLCTPRYKPALFKAGLAGDTQIPPTPTSKNPEESASLLSLVTYQFLDPLIWMAYRTRKPQFDQLPPLLNYDRMVHLKYKHFGRLDPLRSTKRRSLFLGLMHVFWKEYFVMTLMVMIKSFMDFAGPVSLRFLLKYLANPSEPDPIRPWVWVSLIFVGPVLGSIAFEWYKYLVNRALAHAEGLITQLLFEHTLRIRMTSSSTESIDSKGQAKSSGSDVGKITNLMSTDLYNATGGRDFLMVVLSAPIQIATSVVFLYGVLGWSAIIGASVLVLSMPLQTLFGKWMSKTQSELMKKTDARVGKVIESINVIRMIKMFAWENRIKEEVVEKREEELRLCRKQQYLVVANIHINFVVTMVVTVVTFATYTLWMGQSIDASIVFSSMAVFEMLRSQLYRVFTQVPIIIQSQVSFKRIDDFLNSAELLDIYTKTSEPLASATLLSTPSPLVGFRDITFTWAPQTVGSQAPSQRNFRLRIDGELIFQPGKINMIVGPTGCGKTSVLMALLGEMHSAPSSSESWFGLPREGGVAYAAQEAWIQNGSIRQNILFGTGYDQERYDLVISQCALEPDLALFDAGDETEVGERGITLSGGQKARISLARAIYSTANILILDDVFSSLDVHTARWIVDQCLKGDLVAGRTVVMVTHNIAMVSEVSSFAVVLGPEGRVISQGSVSEVLRTNFDICTKLKEGIQEETKSEKQGDVSNPTDRKSSNKLAPKGLVVAEEVAQGHVDWPALRLFLLSLGGPGFWFLYLTGFTLSALGLLAQTYWLGIWARAYDEPAGRVGEVDDIFYVGVYSVICASVALLSSIMFLVHAVGSIRASRLIHGRLLASMLGAPLRWLDSTPVGRITARFTQDIRSVDGPLPSILRGLITKTIQLGSRLVAIVIFSPVFIFPGLILVVCGYWIGQAYILAQLWVKRETSNARSPVFTHFGSSLAGIATIRAFGVEDEFKTEAMRRIDRYTRATRTFYNVNRWICIRMDALGAAFSGALAVYLVYGHVVGADASNTGFSLNVAIAFSSGILWWVRNLSELEIESNSLERIQDYLSIEQEQRPILERVPPAYWPASGKLVVENLVARYSIDGPAVLHGLSFEIKSGERVGVVGRTGSGKSSLTLSLLRMIPIEGNIYYDGIPTHAINLDALRSSITIIPQQPELTSGTVRQNIDPFDEYDDAALSAALRSAGLNALQDDDGEGYIGLDSSVSTGGGNFSLGQRQIIALARAILRRTKLLILDEATAAIDYKTDSVIQKSIRTELNGMTLIIVAHRLETICDADKILVLDAGNIVEFDSPAALLQKDRGVFKSMVDESGDRDALYAMAKK